MSTATARRSTHIDTRPVTFASLLRSEWIKLWSVRSTWWTLSITVAVMVLLALFYSASIVNVIEADPEMAAEMLPANPGASAISFGYFFAQISVAVLGAMVITGEYATGMIRSTLTAAPDRIRVILAKATVLSAVLFALGVAGGVISWAATAPILVGGDLVASLGEPQTWQALAGLGAYLVYVGLLSMALGLILRHAAGAIATILGALLVLPNVLIIASSLGVDWAIDIYPYLPAQVGEVLMSTTAGDTFISTPGGAGLVMLGYVAVLFVIGLGLIRRRDA